MAKKPGIPRVTVGTTLSLEVLQKVDALAEKRGVTRSEMVNWMVVSYLGGLRGQKTECPTIAPRAEEAQSVR